MRDATTVPPMPRHCDPDPDLPRVVTAGEAYSAGLSRDQVRQRVRSGRWLRLAQGVYHRDPAFLTASPAVGDFDLQRQQHADLATARSLSMPGCSLALHSAVALHGLPLVGPWESHVALNAPLGSWNGRRPGIVIHRMTIDPRDIVQMRVPVTSVARTCIDVARLVGTRDGLIVADAAMRAGSVTTSELLDVAHHTVDTRRTRQGILVANAASPLRESPGESASWAYFLRHAVRLPRLQAEIRTHGRRVARVDFLWEDLRLVGEFDGRLKYQSSEDLYEEKVREDALRAQGYRVVRWGWPELSGPDFAARLLQFLTPASQDAAGTTPAYGMERKAG